jgi:hypothetical protein
MRLFGSFKPWHALCHLYLESPSHSRRTIMKFENLLLRSLFTACSLACLLTLGSMLV